MLFCRFFFWNWNANKKRKEKQKFEWRWSRMILLLLLLLKMHSMDLNSTEFIFTRTARIYGMYKWKFLFKKRRKMIWVSEWVSECIYEWLCVCVFFWFCLFLTDIILSSRKYLKILSTVDSYIFIHFPLLCVCCLAFFLKLQNFCLQSISIQTLCALHFDICRINIANVEQTHQTQREFVHFVK